jgi:hypothetical protein
MFGIEADADAPRELQEFTFQREWQGQLAQDFLSRQLGVAHFDNGLGQHHKLVSGKTRSAVRCNHLLGQVPVANVTPLP